MARLLADENFPIPVSAELRSLGHNVVTLQEAGKTDRGFSDAAVLALAAEQDRAILTLNRRHFVRLHRESESHAGIVVCSLDIDFVGQARRINREIESVDGLSGRLVRINRPG